MYSSKILIREPEKPRAGQSGLRQALKAGSTRQHFSSPLSRLLEKSDERCNGVGVRELVVNTVTVARVSNRSVRERKRDVLRVVPDDASQALLPGRHRAPTRCHPLATRSTGQLPSGMPRRVGRYVQ